MINNTIAPANVVITEGGDPKSAKKESEILKKMQNWMSQSKEGDLVVIDNKLFKMELKLGGRWKMPEPVEVKVFL